MRRTLFVAELDGQTFESSEDAAWAAEVAWVDANPDAAQRAGLFGDTSGERRW